ncbi:MAG: hypothetical protein IJH34_09930 [Romboutsia sp.]|nr:hypothetical protein [Romboutsia sp.]
MTNVAWISEAYDAESDITITNQEGLDRDSEPSTTPEVNKNNMSEYKGNDSNKDTLSDSTYYYKGKQDDDDFEKIKIPKAEGKYSIRLQKVNSRNTSQNLSGAQFNVKLADGTTKNITSQAGYVTIAEDVAITAAGTDTIEITETNAPNGFKKLINTLTVNLTKTLSNGAYGVTAVTISDTTNASYDLNNNVISITVKDEPKTFDLGLRKFITAVSTDGNFSNTSTTTTYSRVPSIASTEVTALKNLTATFNEGKTAKKEHTKTPVEVGTGNRVLYTIRVYNEGEVDGKATEITDYLPSGLKLAEGSTINSTYGWTQSENKITTSYLSGKTIGALTGETINYEDIQVECEVTAEAGANDKSLKNVAEITDSSNDFGFEDRDSEPDNVEETGEDYDVETSPQGKGYEDDDDYDEIVVPSIQNGKYNIILVKEDENGEQLNSKAVFELRSGNNETETKEVTGKLTIVENVEINSSNVETLDVYRIKEVKAPDKYCKFEGTIEITVKKKVDGNTYIVENISYKVFDSEEKEITTQDAKVYLKDGNIFVEVKNYKEQEEPKEEEPKKEEPEDSKEFDLALRKWVTQAIITENGQQRVVNTGHGPYDDPEAAVKVEINKKFINTTTVKFRYSIRVSNEGDIAGYAKEITDYVPSGLKFISSENQEWTDEGNNVISTKQLENSLIQPGEYKEISVLLTWVNNESNLGLKTNIAEISEDYNEFNIPDKDSTPNNKKSGEDDIDDAPVLLSLKTGQIRIFFILGFAILTILGSGIVLIKKYVLNK